MREKAGVGTAEVEMAVAEMAAAETVVAETEAALRPCSRPLDRCHSYRLFQHSCQRLFACRTPRPHRSHRTVDQRR